MWFYILTIWCKSANQGIKYSCKKRNLQYISWFLLPEVTAARFNILSALLSKKLNARAQNRENTHMMAPEKNKHRKISKNTVEKYIIQKENQMLQTNRPSTIFDEINHHTIIKYFQNCNSQQWQVPVTGIICTCTLLHAVHR